MACYVLHDVTRQGSHNGLNLGHVHQSDIQLRRKVIRQMTNRREIIEDNAIRYVFPVCELCHFSHICLYMERAQEAGTSYSK